MNSKPSGYSLVSIGNWSPFNYCATVYPKHLLNNPANPPYSQLKRISWTLTQNGQTYSSTRFVTRNRSAGCPVWSSYVVNSICYANSNSDPINNGNPDCSISGASAGNPINVATGNKFQAEEDYLPSSKSKALRLVRHYNSQGNNVGYFGNNWSSLLDLKLQTGTDITKKHAGLEDGKVLTFNHDGTQWISSSSPTYLLDQTVNGFILTSGDTVYFFDLDGKIQRIEKFSILYLQYFYDDNDRPYKISDQLGNEISISFNERSFVSTIVTPDQALEYTYANLTSPNTSRHGNLLSVKNIGFSPPKTRSYVYENNTLPRLLTGIIDENGTRYATFQYNAQGRATSTEHAGTTNKYSVAYTTDSSGNVTAATVTDPRSTVRTYNFQTVLGAAKTTAISQPCTSGCASGSTTTYDTNGNIATRTDFNGTVTTYTYDLARNLETARTEAYGTALARTITTAWHATYRLPTQIDEPNRRTLFTYDANGNVLSKTITDMALSKSRTWAWTYNGFGQVLTADGPRTDVSDVTTYVYYSADHPGGDYRTGDLASVTNALGHTTEITHYDGGGRPLSITDANAIVTTLTYDARGRLLTRTVGARTTTYTYDGVGQLTRATLPDSSYLEHTYDAAHRLTAVADNLGNRTQYTLDAMGNRTAESTYDPSNALTQTRSRVFNSLNRLYRDIGGTSPGTQITQYGYDNSGNLTTVTDPLSRVTTNNYDALGRLAQITDPASGVTTNTYDALDQLTGVTDPRTATTTYTRDALGNVIQTQSPDSGTSDEVYDAAGNVVQKTDARGIVAQHTYDALNRLTSTTYPGHTAENALFSYDSTANGNKGIGRLTGYENDGGATVLMYDGYGNVVQQTAIVGSTLPVTAYNYDSADRVVTITYPSGRIVTYFRNSAGLITRIETQDDSGTSAVVLADNIAYKPFGPMAAITFGNGVATTLQYDQDYRVTRITAASTPDWDFVYTYNADGSIQAQTDQNGGTYTRTFGYDNLNRLTLDINNTGEWTYSYDANGNRLGFSLEVPPDPAAAIPQTYASNSNRTATMMGLPVNHDAAGNQIDFAGIDSFTYNHANRLSSHSGSATTTYLYNAQGQRIQAADTTTTLYHYALDGKYLAATTLDASGDPIQLYEYIWLDDTPIAQITTTYGSGGTVSARRTTYIHADHLNTPRAMTDSTRTIVWRWDGDTYGFVGANPDPDGDSQYDFLDLRFPGQIVDRSSGLHYNYFRDYDPGTGRYIQSDPIGLKGGRNTYSYVDGNPVQHIDPDGLMLVLAVRLAAPVAHAVRSASAALGIAIGNALHNEAAHPDEEEALAADCNDASWVIPKLKELIESRKRQYKASGGGNIGVNPTGPGHRQRIEKLEAKLRALEGCPKQCP